MGQSVKRGLYMDQNKPYSYKEELKAFKKFMKDITEFEDRAEEYKRNYEMGKKLEKITSWGNGPEK